MKYIIWLLLALPLFSQDAEVIGSTGNWSLNGRKYDSHQKLHAGDRLKGSIGSEIVVACARNHWLAYSCPAVCEIPICGELLDGFKVRRVDPYGWADPKEVSGDMTSSILRRRTPNLPTLAARAAGNLNDGVLRLDNNRVSIAPALERLYEGDYCFQFNALPGMPKPISVKLNWQQKGEGVAELGKVTPGLYTMELGTPGQADSCRIEEPDGPKAWVLIVPADQYESVQKQWNSYAQGLKQLAEESGDNVSSTVRHGLLSALADSILTKQ